MTIGRRVVLKVLGSVPLVAVLGCDDDTEVVPAGKLFNSQNRIVLAGLADVIIPDEPDSPGGAKLGAVPYIERLLTAFEVDPPAIFADGPYSGRTPFPDGTVPPNDFARFVPLDRVQEAAWRKRIDNLRTLFKTGLDTIPIDTKKEDYPEIFRGLDGELQDAIIDFVSQAAFGVPEYGGNPNGAGWKLSRFEGDSQPLGYTIYDATIGGYRERVDHPMSQPDTQPDPAPMDADTIALLAEVVKFTGGKVFR